MTHYSVIMAEEKKAAAGPEVQLQATISNAT